MKNNAMRHLGIILAALLCSSAVLSITAAAQQQPPTPGKKILLIHSYHAEYPWVAAITAGVRKALAGENITLSIFYMDTKRNTAVSWKTKAGEQARKMIVEWQPDAVIAADDDAQLFVTRNYVNKKPWFVFCGVNGEPADYGLPAANVTGIIERPFFAESLAYLKQVLRYSSRAVNRAVVISDTGATSVGALSYMRSEAQDTDFKVLGYHLISDFPRWQKRITEYNAEETVICIYTYHTIKSPGAAASMDPQQLLQWTAANCIVPTVGFLDFAIEGGLLCGVVESGEEHGYEAARMALDLLCGKDIRSLPIKRANRGLKMINLQTAEKLGISVPEDVIKSADRVFR
jgi:ABC-type uncharacterized transport system substrate-binding protein